MRRRFEHEPSANVICRVLKSARLPSMVFLALIGNVPTFFKNVFLRQKWVLKVFRNVITFVFYG